MSSLGEINPLGILQILIYMLFGGSSSTPK